MKLLRILAFVLPTAAAQGQFDYTPAQCASCAEWNAPQKPLRIFGNSWFVGTHGLSAILITSPQAHVLIDGGLPASAPAIIANVRALGFRMEDVKLIVNSHAHFDHAGGLAELQRASGATVAGTAWSARAFTAGTTGADDPQFGILLPYAPVHDVRAIADGETLRAGAVAVTAHLTAGHTPGGTTWTWRSCEGSVCKDIVYADSQTPVSATGFFYTRSEKYPNAIADFEHGFTVLESLSCDILLTPHPGVSKLWERVDGKSLEDRDGCKRYAATAREALARRIKAEQAPE